VPVIVLTAKDLTAADHERLAGPAGRVLRKGALGQDELLAELGALVGGREPRK